MPAVRRPTAETRRAAAPTWPAGCQTRAVPQSRVPATAAPRARCSGCAARVGVSPARQGPLAVQPARPGAVTVALCRTRSAAIHSSASWPRSRARTAVRSRASRASVLSARSRCGSAPSASPCQRRAAATATASRISSTADPVRRHGCQRRLQPGPGGDSITAGPASRSSMHAELPVPDRSGSPDSREHSPLSACQRATRPCSTGTSSGSSRRRSAASTSLSIGW